MRLYRWRQPRALSACDPPRVAPESFDAISPAKKLDQGEQLGALADNG
jgi:hypothetical protein